MLWSKVKTREVLLFKGLYVAVKDRAKDFKMCCICRRTYYKPFITVALNFQKRTRFLCDNCLSAFKNTHIVMEMQKKEIKKLFGVRV